MGALGAICALYLKFVTKRNRVTSRKCQFYSYNSELAFLSHPLFEGLRGDVWDSFNSLES